MTKAKRGTEFQPRAFRQTRNLVAGAVTELAAPIIRPLARLASKGAKCDPHEWRKGLIVGHNHIGDVLYRTASLPVLHSAFPDCRWSYLTSRSAAPILEGNPNIDEVLPWNRGLDAWDMDVSHRRQLEQSRFDVILCTNTLRHYPELLFASWLGIPNRVGFAHKGLSALINHPIPIEFPSPFASYFRSMVAELAGRAPDWPLTPEIFLTSEHRGEAERALRNAKVSPYKPILACSLTTRQVHGNWPVASMLSIIREARSMLDFHLVLCGSPDDAASLRFIASNLGADVTVMAGAFSLRGFAAFLQRCAALFSLDSGPRHIGNAVGTRVIFARNMSHSQVEAGKYCVTETDIAPAGEYLSDAEIAATSATVSIRHAADIIAGTIQNGETRA